jgi:hypothetical protein
MTPVGDATGRPTVVTERTVSYRFLEGWSLITLLLQHAAGPGDLSQSGDSRQGILMFPVQTEPARDGSPIAAQRDAAPAAKEPDRGTAKLFVRLSVRAIVKEEGKPDREERIALPVFPAEAPRLAEGG